MRDDASVGADGTTVGVSTVADGSIGTLVTAGTALQLDLGAGTHTIANESLVLNNTGIGGTGALENVSGTNTWTGVINLASSSTIGVTAGSLTVAGTGVVSGASDAELTKIGNGTLAFQAANTVYLDQAA